jgi:hypothetical protein
MTEETQTPFIERLQNPEGREDPYEYSKELHRLRVAGDFEGMKAVYDAYVVGIGLANPDLPLSEVERMAKDNLLIAATLADLIIKDDSTGEPVYKTTEPLRVVMSGFVIEGPICKFYREAINFPKEKAEGEQR